jgi:hypothetical protein
LIGDDVKPDCAANNNRDGQRHDDDEGLVNGKIAEYGAVTDNKA